MIAAIVAAQGHFFTDRQKLSPAHQRKAKLQPGERHRMITHCWAPIGAPSTKTSGVLLAISTSWMIEVSETIRPQ